MTGKPALTKKRKPGRRIHFGRLALVLVIFGAIIAIPTAFISRCNRENSETTADDIDSEIDSQIEREAPEPVAAEPLQAEVEEEQVIEEVVPVKEEQVPEVEPVYVPKISPHEAGERDAARALNYAPGSMERQNALLLIHSRESKLRAAGYNISADRYIKAVRDRLAGEF